MRSPRPPHFLTRQLFAAGLIALGLFALPRSRADYADDIGLNALRAELGATIPTGIGVGISQVEASLSTTAKIYTPDLGQAEFSGKTIFAKSGISTVSSHANAVATYLFGNTGSLSPGVSNIDVYEANAWVFSGFLKTNTLLAPSVENRDIQNHSWIGTVDNGGPDDIEILRRFDFAMQRDDFLAAVGLNNGSGTAVPALLANAYNAISVGLTNGGHSSGASTLDGAGRVKPEIVAPFFATSFATPLVGSAGALLLQAAPAAGRHSVALKAMLLAGATKDQIAGWSRTTTRPLDGHFGAGQLNVQHSYHILAAGQRPASSSVSVGSRGWDFNTTAAVGKLYFFDIFPSTAESRLSAVLTWNRIVEDTIPTVTWGNPSSTVPDLTLRIFAANGFAKGSLVDESVSAVDNVEHLYAPTLLPGRYALEVTGNTTGIAYGLAWNTVANFSITATATDATERGFTPGSFTITRSGDLSNPLTVAFTVTGTATTGSDFVALPATATIPANAASTTISITPVMDALAEGDETVTITLASGLAATFADANATITLRDQPIDAWRHANFTTTELANSAISGDLADLDRDGIANLVEYALGLDPKTPNANAVPSTAINNGGFPELTFTKSTTAVDVGYIVEVSTNLVDWNSVETVAAAPVLPASTTTQTVSVPSPAMIGSAPVQFMRLRITRQ